MLAKDWQGIISSLSVALFMSLAMLAAQAQDLEHLSSQELDALKKERLAVLSNYDGTWEGILKIQAVRGVADPKWQQFPLKLRLTISGTTPKVALFDNGQWQDMKDYSFQMIRNKSNAVIACVVSADDGGWVETWNLTLTQLEKDTVFLVSNRVVNNYLLSSDRDFARAVFVGQGEFKRVLLPQ